MKMTRLVSLLVLVLVLALSAQAQHAVKNYHWKIRMTNTAPDCVTRRIPTINGKIPGPAIRVTEGDRVKIHVCNHISHNVTLHWHGLRQLGTEWYDGSAYGAQCPITPGNCFLYDFVAHDQYGTHFTHGHIDMLRMSVFGAFIIYPRNHTYPFAKPAKEFVLQANDWYHVSTYGILRGLAGKGHKYKFMPAPDSILINGKGKYDCKKYKCVGSACGKCLAKSNKCGTTVYEVEHGKTYLFRVINTGMWAQMNLEVQGHNMTLVAVDSWYVKPHEISNLHFKPGMVFDVLIKADKHVGSYWIGVNGQFETFGTHAVAILKYKGTKNALPSGKPPPGPDTNKHFYSGWEEQQLYKNLHSKAHILAEEPVKKFALRFVQNVVDGHQRYSVNNCSFIFPHSGIGMLEAAFVKKAGVYTKMNRLPSVFGQISNKQANSGKIPARFCSGFIDIEHGDMVQIVIQNYLPPGGHHPWHIHGLDFYVIGYFRGTYDPAKEHEYAKKYNLNDPPLRNMIAVYQDTFVVLRFKAVNDGVWNMHCHLDPHNLFGMQLFVRVKHKHNKVVMQKPPSDYPTCSAIFKFPVETAP